MILRTVSSDTREKVSNLTTDEGTEMLIDVKLELAMSSLIRAILLQKSLKNHQLVVVSRYVVVAD